MLSNPLLQEKLAAESSALRNLRRIIKQLADTYTLLRNSLENSSVELGRSIDKKRGISLIEKIKDDVNSHISNWDEWRVLFNNLQEGSIKVSESGGIAEDREELIKTLLEGLKQGEKSSTSKNYPNRSDDFYEYTFKETVEILEKDTHENIRQAIKDLLNELSNYQVSLQHEQTTIDLASLRNDLMQCLQSSEAQHKIPYILTYSTDPILWEKNILFKQDSLSNITPKDIFPLALEDKDKNKPGLIFPWARERKHADLNQENHQIFVMSLKDKMISRVSEQFVQLVSVANKQVNEKLKLVVLEAIIFGLEKLLKNNEELRTIALGGAQPNVSTPDWLEILTELTSIQCPL